MSSEDFRLEVFGPAAATVYLAPSGRSAIPWSVVRRLDAAGVLVVGDLAGLRPDAERVRRIVAGCAGVLGDDPAALALGEALGLPVHALAGEDDGGDDGVDRFLEAALAARAPAPAYAFFVGRLERDFAHARDAIRAAVERDAGLPCLWADDGRHRANVDSVRERTRLLIKHASFVVADLTLGVESPDRENPSRAHEVGMAIAYGRPLMLSSQEPRRYPYFSVADMQMAFWETEDELEARVREWIRASREQVARRVLNAELGAAGAGPRLDAPPPFAFDPARRYVGPRTRVARGDVPRTTAAAPAIAAWAAALRLLGITR
jgi:hypothetical protein